MDSLEQMVLVIIVKWVAVTVGKKSFMYVAVIGIEMCM
jgi:hypothetical protein